MSRWLLRSSFVVTAAIVFTGCGDDDASTACVPGESVACVGPGGCSGGQVCLPDGSGFDTCDCRPPDFGTIDMGSGGDAGAPTSDGGTEDDAGETSDGGLEVDGGPVACDPVAGTGCGASEKCTFIVDESGVTDGETRCVADGSVAAGGDCVRESGGDDCEAGSFCSDGICLTICDQTDGSSCAEGDGCVGFFGLFVDRENVGLCQLMCDPAAQDCPEAGDACFLSVSAEGTSFCAAPTPDPAAEGEDCNFANDCVPGTGCAVINDTGDGLACAYFCDASGSGGPACDDPEGPGADHGCIPLGEYYSDTLNDVAAATAVCVDCSALPAGMYGCPS